MIVVPPAGAGCGSSGPHGAVILRWSRRVTSSITRIEVPCWTSRRPAAAVLTLPRRRRPARPPCRPTASFPLGPAAMGLALGRRASTLASRDRLPRYWPSSIDAGVRRHLADDISRASRSGREDAQLLTRRPSPAPPRRRAPQRRVPRRSSTGSAARRSVSVRPAHVVTMSPQTGRRSVAR